MTPEGWSGPELCDPRERAAYLALALTPGIGHARLHDLLQAFDGPGAALVASEAELLRLPGIRPTVAAAIRSASAREARDLLHRVERLGAGVLLPGDGSFPQALRCIAEPPPVLFAQGRLDLLGRPAVAIVGSRDHSAYGAEVCAAISREAADAGLVVVSGMARGLDAAAHQACLEVAGATIGVLGNGLGVIYPAANRGLYQRVAETGLLLTEFVPGERPSAGSFPRRNRLIAGLARATVVVEAAIGSGALITAGEAMEQGKEVLAVPGPITSSRSAGANRLIRDGAKPLLELRDLLELYPEASPRRADPPDREDTPRGRLLGQLGLGPAHVDALSLRLGWSPAETLGLLGALEVEGIVAQRPGLVFTRTSGLMVHRTP